MSVLDQWIAKARVSGKKIVLPEGVDSRVVEAANRVVKAGIAQVTVIGTPEEIEGACKQAGLTERLFTVVDHTTSPDMPKFVAEYKRLRDLKKPITIEEAQSKMANRIFFGAMMTKLGLVDGLVAGSIASTADMLRAAFSVIGTAPGIKSASSAFIMDLPRPAPNGEKCMLFGDCAVIPDPTAEQLVDIAFGTCATYSALFEGTPKVAFLAFSTFGSASHEMLEKIQTASKMFCERIAAEKLNILCDPQEVQLDSAIVPDVAKMKCRGGSLQGSANILIFPDLNAGNIGYKLAQRLGGVDAFGPALQGLALPLNDLSRGCSVEDIVGTCALTVCQACNIKK